MVVYYRSTMSLATNRAFSDRSSSVAWLLATLFCPALDTVNRFLLGCRAQLQATFLTASRVQQPLSLVAVEPVLKTELKSMNIFVLQHTFINCW